MAEQKKLKRHDWNVTQVDHPDKWRGWITEPTELQPYYDVLDDIESRYEMAESKAERGKLEKLHTKWNNMRPSWFHTGKYPREGAMPGFGRLETRTAYSTGGGGSKRDVLVHEDPLPKINRYWEDRKSEVREVYSGELSGEPMSKSIDDIMQQSNLVEAITPAVSTRTQPSGKAISDISIPTSEKYGAPADIRLGKTVSKGIPMNMKKITDALNVALTSPEYSKSWTDETWIPQKKRAEKSIGELLGMTAGFNKTREGKRFIQKMLEKYSKMDAPRGLVGYRTEEGFPYYEGEGISGVFLEAKSPESPDTIAVFGDKSSWSLAPFLNTLTGVPVPKSIAADTKRPSRTLFHEGIHATAEEGTPLKDMGLLPYHQYKFNKPEEDIIESYKDIPTEYGTAMDPWIAELLYNAMMDKESEGAKLLKGFIK